MSQKEAVLPIKKIEVDSFPFQKALQNDGLTNDHLSKLAQGEWSKIQQN